MKTFFITLFFLSIITIAFSQSTPQIEWQFGTVGDNLGKAAIFIEDIDNNGFIDIISTTEFGFGSFLTMLEYDNDQKIYVTKRISNYIHSKFKSAQFYDFNGNREKELYIGLENGKILKYNSTTLKKELDIHTLYQKPKLNHFDDSNPVNSIKFADIDGSTFLIALRQDTTYILNGNYDIIYEIPFGSENFEIANIDNDEYKEIVYSNGKIIELRQDTIAEESGFYTYNKDNKIGLSNMNNDEIKDIVYSSKDTIYVYDFKAKQTIWSKAFKNDIYSVKDFWLIDYDNDTILDVLVSYYNEGELFGYNGKTGIQEFDLVIDNQHQPDNIKIADFDNDSKDELLWATGINDSGPDHFYVYDISTKTKEWQSRDFEGDFKAFDIGDVDNDEKLEIVLGNHGEYLKYYDHAFLTILDAQTKHIEWQNEAEIIKSLQDITKIKIGDIDNNGRNELLVGVENHHTLSFVYVLDSLFKIERSFEVDGMDIILDMIISDVDNDDKNELIITSGTNVQGGSGEWKNHIHIFDGETGNLKWKSDQLGAVNSKIGSIKVGNIDQDDAKEIVAIKYRSLREKSSLYVIDGITYELISDTLRSYSSLDIADIDKDGTDDLIVGTAFGQIEIIGGNNLETLETFETNTREISGLKAYDLNNDGNLEVVLSDYYTIGLFDLQDSELIWRSDSLNHFVGRYNSLFVDNIDSDPEIEILVNAQHGIFSFETDYDKITSVEFIENQQSDNTTISYPNPAKDIFTIKTSNEIPKLIDIVAYDITGRIVIEKKNQLSQDYKTVNVNISDLKQGLYSVVLLKDDKVYSITKLIKGVN